MADCAAIRPGIDPVCFREGTNVMRFQVRLAAATAALFMGTAGVASAQSAGEYIVSAQVVSDEVVGTPAGQDAAVAETDTVVAGPVARGAIAAGGYFQGVPFAGRAYGQPDLFYNYYTQGYSNRVNAQMYLAPQPVPPHVGHTFYTYQPFMPHEMLYKHVDRYHNYYDNGRGTNRTKAHYYYPPVRRAASNFYWNALRIPR